MSDFQVRLLPGARKYFKSLKKNHPLRNKFQTVIEELQRNPYQGKEMKVDLAGVFTIDFRHNKTVYELAYFVNKKEEGQFIFVISAGTRENFYEELKRYLRSL